MIQAELHELVEPISSDQLKNGIGIGLSRDH